MASFTIYMINCTVFLQIASYFWILHFNRNDLPHNVAHEMQIGNEKITAPIFLHRGLGIFQMIIRAENIWKLSFISDLHLMSHIMGQIILVKM